MLDVDTLARSLGDGEGVPVEPPGPLKIERPGSARSKWVALAAFGIVGSTGILVITGLSDVHGSTEHAWRDRAELEIPTVLPDGPPVSDRVYAIHVDGLPMIGRSDAKVTLVAVTDYACRNCEASRAIVAGLRGSYGEDLRIVWKPITRDPGTAPALAGACAAALQGELERYDAAIWRIVQAPSYDAPALPDAANPGCASDPAGCRQLTRTARDLGLDGQRFASAIKRCAPLVAASSRELAQLGVVGTTYFVNGRMVDPWGVENAGTFSKLVDVELAKARQRIADGTTQARYYEQWVLAIGK
jgi:protein-disulfide isomerase